LPRKAVDGIVYKPVQEAVPDPACVDWLSFSEDEKAEREAQMAERGAEDFPWPPPVPSTLKVLPNDFFERLDIRTFGDAERHLSAELEGLGYVERTFYDVPQGVAIVMRLEQIDDNAFPIEERWSPDIGLVSPFSLGGYLKSLLTAPKGRFRIIALVGSSKAVAASSPRPSRKDAMLWFARGNNLLDQSLAERCYTPWHRWTALIYEFRKVGSEAPETLHENALSVQQHLDGSGLSRFFSR